ncbi:methylenetetrahydromethanopterin dehydrogenase [Methylobacterium indicum]|uniref:NAD(P)-dependent methylenetetrahydromethanopterin dehydrogenase n=1 Tax=Methylobacterium indicum TaxID=1775910 RepID=UPI000734B799|nr:NAD(P)-dependent methylenetetrahydromethanopterin dehydrogenase [Methylobacterium indicum]KTS38596.1 methylenetetrahydromethanopterin dehydrogenase [Methylobacterium indicum]KTS41195.1 methylenetetrahydromethanopterin dehydrogenase [Methylobacterium indicum]KTS52546.1 methylenetetrahydromethanopterin dehydrogenase [Methylobacterium indicum]
MARSILHMLTPLKHMSPFDVNMAVDAGFEIVSTYTAVEPGEVVPLVQDSIFSRAPQDGTRTAIFIGGKNAEASLDMVDAATSAFVPPFANHVFADPAGSFTTGAAMVACVRKALHDRFGEGLAGKRVAIYGGTGVVAYCAAVIAAQEGAHPVLVGYNGRERVAAIAESIRTRFGVAVEAADGSDQAGRLAAARDAEVILSAAAAGVQVLSAEDLTQAGRLLVAADVNAVPPAGIAGIDVNADAVPLPSGRGVGIGALAIGNVKYGTQAGLFRRLLQADQPLVLDFRDAYRLAVELTGQAGPA